MLNRRTFLKHSSLAAGALVASRFGFAQHAHQPIGVQLYTVRQQVESDLAGTLAQIHAIGYEEVEPYWNVYSHPSKDLKQMLADNHLTAPSGHFDYDDFESKLDYASELGMQYVVCPMLPEKVRTGGLEGFAEAAKRLNHFGEVVKARGMQFCFHNHNYEFHKQGGKTGFEVLMQNTDPGLVGLEMDCYWITQAGLNPVEMLRTHKDRIHLLHVKDRKPGFSTSQDLNTAAEHFTEVGTGMVHWSPILAQARTQGIKHFFVEQDECARPPLESLKISYQNLNRLLNGGASAKQTA